MPSLCSYRVRRAEPPENSGDPVPNGVHGGAPGARGRGLRHSRLEVAAAHRHSAQLLLLALLLVSPFGAKRKQSELSRFCLP